MSEPYDFEYALTDDQEIDADYCDEHEWAGYGECPKCKSRAEALAEDTQEQFRGN